MFEESRSEHSKIETPKRRSLARASVPLLSLISLLLLMMAPSTAAQESTSGAIPGQQAGNVGTCFLYRYRLARGSLEKIGIYIDGIRAANLVNGRWVSIQVPAGHHVITTKDKVSGAAIDVKPGASYYIRASWGEETLSGSTHQLVTLVPKEQAVYEIGQLKLLDEKDISWSTLSKSAPENPKQDLTTDLPKDWGESSTPNTHLGLKEVDRKKDRGSTWVTYHIETSGFPAEKAYTVWQRQSVDQKIVRFIIGYSADASEKLVCATESPAGASRSDTMPIPCTDLAMPLEQFPFGIYDYHKGEPLEYAVISTDGAVRAFARAYPFPIQAKDGKCCLTVELRDNQGNSFMIHGEGFDPGDNIKFASTSVKEEIHDTQQASAQGEISYLLLPGVKGKHSGTVTFTATGTSCSPSVTFEWGSAAMKVQ